MISNSFTAPTLAILVCFAVGNYAQGQTYFDASGSISDTGSSQLSIESTREPVVVSLNDQPRYVRRSTEIVSHHLHDSATPEIVIGNEDQFHPPAQQDITYSTEIQTLSQSPRSKGTWRERTKNHLWDASANARTSGRTVSIFGGPGIMPSYFDGFGRTSGDEEFSGGVIGLSIGRRLNSRWRSEIEVSWRRRDMTSYFYSPIIIGSRYYYPRNYELDTFAGMFNTYYDFDRGPGKILTPYFGVGLGAAHEEVSRGSYSEGQSKFASQLMAGLSVHVTRRDEFYFESRAFTTTQRSGYSSNGFYSRTSYDLIFGFRRTF